MNTLIQTDQDALRAAEVIEPGSEAASVCPACSFPTSNGARFCTSCGFSLTGESAPADGFDPAVDSLHARLCTTCNGDGSALDEHAVFCPECRYLRPLADGYHVDPSAFQWAEDGQAMAALRGIAPLDAAARSISDRVGRRWVETTLNAIRLSERQMPEVFEQAVRAARILGMSTMPEVYVSGEQPWQAATYGSEGQSFVVLGTALVSYFRGQDLLFLFAREMGHCRAGHGLWKTVIRFMMGEQGPRKGLMAGGFLNAINPLKMLEATVELPLLAWARQAEITADRAGLLAVGSEEAARRVLLSWSLKAPGLYQRINLEAWIEQERESGDEMLRLSETVSSSTPYISRRLGSLVEFARSSAFADNDKVIAPLASGLRSDAPAPKRRPPGASEPSIEVTCPKCTTALNVPHRVLAGKKLLNVRCSNTSCGHVMQLRKHSDGAESADRQNGNDHPSQGDFLE